MQQFFGITGYYSKFVFYYSAIAGPLTDLTKKGAEFQWGMEQPLAFDIANENCLSPLVLVFLDFSEQFYLATDTYDYGIGGVLLQFKDNKLHPTAFYSYKLKASGFKCFDIDKEALATVKSLYSFKLGAYDYSRV